MDDGRDGVVEGEASVAQLGRNARQPYPSDVRGPVATIDRDPRGIDCASSRTTSMTRGSVFDPPRELHCEKRSRSTASADPAGTRLSCAAARSTDPEALSSRASADRGAVAGPFALEGIRADELTESPGLVRRACPSWPGASPRASTEPGPSQPVHKGGLASGQTSADHRDRAHPRRSPPPDGPGGGLSAAAAGGAALLALGQPCDSSSTASSTVVASGIAGPSGHWR